MSSCPARSGTAGPAIVQPEPSIGRAPDASRSACRWSSAGLAGHRGDVVQPIVARSGKRPGRTVSVMELRFGVLRAGWGELRRRRTACAELRLRGQRSAHALGDSSTTATAGLLQPPSASACRSSPRPPVQRHSRAPSHHRLRWSASAQHVAGPRSRGQRIQRTIVPRKPAICGSSGTRLHMSEL